MFPISLERNNAIRRHRFQGTARRNRPYSYSPGVEKRAIDEHLPRFVCAASPVSQSESGVEVNVGCPTNECIPHRVGESVGEVLCEDDVREIRVGAAAQHDVTAKPADALSHLHTRLGEVWSEFRGLVQGLERVLVHGSVAV